MNYPARLFRDLLSTWHNDCASHRVDSLAAELAARAGRADAAVCLGLIQKEAIASLFGLTYLLDSYGLVLRQRYRQQGDGVFVFLERKGHATSEFAGGYVTEVYADSLPEFARAA